MSYAPSRPDISHSYRAFEALSQRVLDGFAARPWGPYAGLLALTLFMYLPGVLRLPPVDRTEIVYASASQDMLRRGNFTDPQFRGQQLEGKPIGAFWLQMASVTVVGEEALGTIAPYRLPSLLGVIIAVLAAYGLLTPLLGVRGALIAASLSAVCPILAVEANLAITDGIALAAAVAAQLALMRIYVAARDPALAAGSPYGAVVLPAGPPPSPHRNPPPSPPPGLLLALLFWASQGLGILLNALAVPLLSAATLAALFVFDRKTDHAFGWLARLRPILGIPIMLALGSPWIVTRVIADGGMPFDGLDWSGLAAALGGSQADKWKAAPLSFTLAFILGFLPGTLLLVPAVRRLWRDRAQAAPRFLLAWLIGYLVYLELLSGKPALYAVPPLFPAAAAGVAWLLTRGAAPGAALAFPERLWVPPPLVPALFVLSVYAALLWATDTAPDAGFVVGASLVAAMLWLAGAAAQRRLPAAWVIASATSFAIFLGFTFGYALPHLAKVWPAPRLAEAVTLLQPCAPQDVALLGFREPSAAFVLGKGVEQSPSDIAQRIAQGQRSVALVEARWQDELSTELAKRGLALPPRAGCVRAFNVMRGCPLEFSIYGVGAAPKDMQTCSLPPEFVCAEGDAAAATAEKSRCD